METENVMKRIKLDKVTLNIGTGAPGDKLEKSVKLLTKLSASKPVITKTKKRIPTWGLRPGLEIGCKVTLRGDKAEELVKRLFAAIDHKLQKSKFDSSGNLSFGIVEYLNVPKVEYDSSIGIIGFDVAITLKRGGYRVKQRMIRPAPVSKKHVISKEEAITFIRDTYGVQIA